MPVSPSGGDSASGDFISPTVGGHGGRSLIQKAFFALSLAHVSDGHKIVAASSGSVPFWTTSVYPHLEIVCINIPGQIRSLPVVSPGSVPQVFVMICIS